MNVDIDNFHDARQFIDKNRLIEKSEYISYDLEFTGLKFENNERQRPEHLPYERYKKMKAVVSRFNIIQVGLTFFVNQNDHVIAYPFNFYIFPRENPLRDPIISLQGNTTQFNSNQGMDWNRWIKKGIPYIKISDIKELENLKKNNKTYDEMLQGADEEVIQTVKEIISAGQTLNEGKRLIQIPVPRSNSFFVKKTVDRFIELNFSNFTVKFSTQPNNQVDKTVFILQYLSDEQKQEVFKRYEESIIGFTLIFQKLWKSGKPLIGHNCLFDILYLYESLVATLPLRYTDFKQELRKEERKFYDTKTIANQLSNKNQHFPNGTSLQSIYAYLVSHQKQLLSKSKIKLAEKFDAYDFEKPALHQAGFDAYLTGWIFYQFLNKFPNATKLEGRINMFRSYFQINISQSDNIHPQNVVFVCVVVPYNQFMGRQQIWAKKKTLNKDLRQQFKRAGIFEFVQFHDAFKEIYIEIKPTNTDLRQVVSKMMKLMIQEKIPQIMTLAHFVQVKSKQLGNDKNF